jgi:hypothetical protein
MKKISFVYRNNRLFENWLPKLIELLQKEHEVEVFSFERGTPIEVIHSEIIQLVSKLKERIIISDRTCGDILYKHNENFEKFHGDLDTFYMWAMEKIILPEGERCHSIKLLADDEAELARFRKTFIEIVLRIFKDSGMPTQICVIYDHIFDHFPFCLLCPYDAHDCAKRDMREEQKAAKIIMDLFAESGVGLEKIHLSSREDIKQFDIKGAWIVVDRHALYDEESNSFAEKYAENINEATLLRFPPDEFYLDSILERLIIVSEEEISDLLRYLAEDIRKGMI